MIKLVFRYYSNRIGRFSAHVVAAGETFFWACVCTARGLCSLCGRTRNAARRLTSIFLAAWWPCMQAGNLSAGANVGYLETQPPPGIGS